MTLFETSGFLEKDPIKARTLGRGGGLPHLLLTIVVDKRLSKLGEKKVYCVGYADDLKIVTNVKVTQFRSAYKELYELPKNIT